LEEVQCWWQC